MRRAAPAFRANFLALCLALMLFAAPAGAQESSLLGLPPVPAMVAGTSAMRRLGEKLFFDRGLSANGTLSCAMCHIPAQGFASNQSALSIGMEGRLLRRNAPSLYNVAFKKFLFHDGRETDLAAQVWGPLLAADEMGNSGIGPLIARLRADAEYRPLFEAAFPEEGATMMTLGRAIAAYEAALLRGGGRFDRAVYGGERSALTPQEWKGYEIFTGKAGCAACHLIGPETALFTDQSWHNTGVGFRSEAAGGKRLVQLAPGVFQNVDLAAVGLAKTGAPNDVGRFEITNAPTDRWAYTTPMLRGVSESLPYMHDGSLRTLAEVVEFYDGGGGANPSLDPKIRPLELTPNEKAAIVVFLEAL
ncbi:methylamine utilization protein MauG [Methylocystis sp. FS]|uniref:cytochrome-c peroxidase n=1 Tax=Methylocystis silviterrae TaxID=2743612 RepID=UPI0015843BAB|nr:cytochrome c peroxidase [Methylocystis silviterrae]NUJ81768.1 methylamine utilization protein MauG [Methylocystis silviterrae]